MGQRLTRPAARFTTDRTTTDAGRPSGLPAYPGVFRATEPSAIDVATTLRVEAVARLVLAPCPVIADTSTITTQG